MQVLEQDYFMRMIMQVTHYIARIIRLRQEQKPEQGFMLLGQGYEFFFGLSIDMVERMSATEILHWLRESGRDHDEVNRAFFEFLQTHVDLLEAMGLQEDEDLFPWRMKKVDFYLLLTVDEARYNLLEIAEAMERELTWLFDFVLPDEVYDKAIRYFEMRDQFARAEDVMYVWRESADCSDEQSNREALLDFGVAFYERLQLIDEEQLKMGGLTPEEVVIGRMKWLTGNVETA